MKPNLSNWRILEASKEVRDIWNSQEDHWWWMVGAQNLHGSEGKKHVWVPFCEMLMWTQAAMPFKHGILRRSRERSWDACCTCSSCHPSITTAWLWGTCDCRLMEFLSWPRFSHYQPLFLQPNHALLVCIAVDGVPNTSQRLWFIPVANPSVNHT